MAKPNSSSKNSYAKGRFAENYVTIWLRIKGYKILGKRLKTPVGEIDILAFKKNQLVAIEVKARQNEETARYSIRENQWRRIAKSIQWFQKGNQKYNSSEIRFDAIFLLPFTKISHFRPIHIENAWQPSADL